MELGTRSIRSSGRGSGSIEITLPSRLRALSGLACRVTWHEAPVPHIMLEPDLRAAGAALARVWDLLLPALGLPPGPPPPLQIGLAEGTGLSWDDALALNEPGPHEAITVSRVLAGLATLARPEPAGFGAVLAFLATGDIPGPAHREACAIAAAAFALRPAIPLDGFGEPLWQALARQAGPLLALQQALAANPARHAALREAAASGAPLDLRGLLP